MQVSCGVKHTLFLDIYGHAFATGSNKLGRLGIDTVKHSKETQYFPVPISLDARIAQVAAGDSHSLFVSHKEGIVYACGDNSVGQLGQELSGDKLDSVSQPIQVKGLRYVRDIACKRYSMAVTEEGHLYMWGNGPAINYGLIPQRICSIPAKVSSIAIGDT
jgi:alpha-tubulin suppressor-like RCC1 family protein